MKFTVFALLAFSASAQPYRYLSYKMISTAEKPFDYYVDARSSTPAGLDLALVRAAADRAWATWNAVSCAAPKVRSRGLTTGVVPNPEDSYDVYSVTPVWFESSDDEDFKYIFGSGQVASIAVAIGYGGVLQTCDIYFNATNKRWSTNATTPADAHDVETLMLHEAGHCLGLDHYGNEDNIMFPSLPVGKQQHELGPGDAVALCERNPVEGAIGAPCEIQTDCSTGTSLRCLPQPLTNGQQYSLCSQACELGSGGGCPLPMTCQASNAFAGSTGACLLPGEAVNRIGQPCDENTDCGSSSSVCNLPVPSPSSNTFWVAGYCTQSCAVGQANCPAGSSCLDVGLGPQCLQSCRVGLADCRPSYTCFSADQGSELGVCIPRCYTDADCSGGGASTCRVCDGLCVSRNSPTGRIGEQCETDATCGPGQICRALWADSAVKACTQQCARGCGTCPSGSTCTPLGQDQLFCLRDCQGPGTCPEGLQCGQTGVGLACIAACSDDLQCPVGDSCVSGQCQGPRNDAGCGTLCNSPDSGQPITPTPDGGTGGGRSGGCGCNESGSGAGLLGLLFLLHRSAKCRVR